MDLSRKVFGENVDPKIVEYFEKLQESNFDLQPGDPVGVSYDKQTYIGDRTPFVRMWTAINTRVSGSSDADSSNKLYIVNDNQVQSYEPNQSLSDLNSNQYLKPQPGITSVRSKSEGTMGALRRTTVDFVVHNKEELESIFLPFFLRPGSTVFVDFGWSDDALSLYDPNDYIKNNDLKMENLKNEVFKTPLEDLGLGFKSTTFGQVTKYNISIDEKGSFICNLEFVSSNFSLLDRNVDDDNDLQFIFDNVIQEIILDYTIRTVRDKDSEEQYYDTETNTYRNYNYEFGNRLSEIEKIDSEKRKEFIQTFFDNFFTTSDGSAREGLITSDAAKIGVYYENYSGNNSKLISEKESLYISFGLFEDLFLNNLVSYWVYKDSNTQTETKQKSKKGFTPAFYSNDSWVRFDEDLHKMNNKVYMKRDKVVSFLYPNGWDNTYNKTENKPNGWTNTSDDIKLNRIPLRELFINVPLISEAFKGSKSVNDALEFIFERIYKDSGTILNIRMIPNDDAQVTLTFQDINMPTSNFEEKKMLTFDVTSGNSVVLNSDLKFETPSTGLSSMIAIRNLSEPAVFDEEQLMKFHLLNAIDGQDDDRENSSNNEKFIIQSLPMVGEISDIDKAVDIDINEFLDSTLAINQPKSNSKAENNIKTKISKLNSSLGRELNKIKEEERKETNSDNTDTDTNVESLAKVNELGQKIFYARTDRDKSLLEAKMKNFIISSDNSISPVLPVSLGITIYGNNFLGYGDFINVNFLPSHYKNRVYFQILGVEHQIDTNMWKTTYNTVMRMKARSKQFQFSDKSKSENFVIELHPQLVRLIAQRDFENNWAGFNSLKNVKDGKNKSINADGSSDPDLVPPANFEEKIWTFNAELNADKIKNEKDSGLSRVVGMTAQSPTTLGQFAWIMAVTDLYLGKYIAGVDRPFDWGLGATTIRPEPTLYSNHNDYKNSINIHHSSIDSGLKQDDKINGPKYRNQLILTPVYADETFLADKINDRFESHFIKGLGSKFGTGVGTGFKDKLKQIAGIIQKKRQTYANPLGFRSMTVNTQGDAVVLTKVNISLYTQNGADREIKCINVDLPDAKVFNNGALLFPKPNYVNDNFDAVVDALYQRYISYREAFATLSTKMS